MNSSFENRYDFPSNYTPSAKNVKNPLPNNLETFLDFDDSECRVMSFCYAISSLIGTATNLMVVMVLCNKLRESVIRVPTDLLMLNLTFICLIACSFLFPSEAIKCNQNNSDFIFALTFFLEVASTTSMLSIAINRSVITHIYCYIITIYYCNITGNFVNRAKFFVRFCSLLSRYC